MKQFIADYFSFTKKERSGTIMLLLLISIFVILPFLFPLFIRKKTINAASFQKEIALLKTRQAEKPVAYQRKNYDEQVPYYQPEEKNSAVTQAWKGELFYFDPNTIDEAGWKKLRVKEKTITTIENYISKGGKFYKAEDIQKIWD